MNFASKLNQTIVHWAAAGSRDKFGRDSFAAGVELTGRWQDKVEEFTNALGERELSAAILYFDASGTVPAADDRVYLGTLASLSAPEQADPNLVQAAHTVRDVGRAPSRDAGQTLAKLWLKA